MSGAEEALQLDPAADEAAPDDPSAAREAELVEKRRMIELRKAELELEELEQHLEERREMTRIRLKLERRKLLTFSSKIRSNVTGSLPDACLSTSLTPDAEKWAVQKRALLNEFEKKGDRSQRRSIAEILRDAHEERDRYDEDKDFGELHLETYVAVMEHCIPAELQRQLQLDYFGKPLTAWVKLCRFHAGPAHLAAMHATTALRKHMSRVSADPLQWIAEAKVYMKECRSYDVLSRRNRPMVSHLNSILMENFPSYNKYVLTTVYKELESFEHLEEIVSQWKRIDMVDSASARVAAASDKPRRGDGTGKAARDDARGRGQGQGHGGAKTNTRGVECWICFKSGHRMYECKLREALKKCLQPDNHACERVRELLLKDIAKPDTDARKTAEEDQYTNRHYVVRSSSSSSNSKAGVGSSISIRPGSSETAGRERLVSFVVDTGTTRHMTPDESLLHNKRPLSGVSVYFGDGKQRHPATCSGTLRGTIKDEKGNWCQLDIHDVLCVPSLAQNNHLISVSPLRKSKGGLVAKDSRAYLDIGDTRVPLSWSSREITLDLRVLPDAQRMARTAGVTRQQTMQELHESLGHVSANVLRKAAKCTHGVDLSDSSEQLSCEACLLNKSRKQPHAKAATLHAPSFCGERLCVDFTPMPEKSREGYQYFITVVDDFSSYARVYFTRTRSAAEYLPIFDDVLRVFQLPEKVRSDNEFMTKPLAAFWEELGVAMELTAPHTPKQNAKVEKVQSLLVERARTSLNAAQLDHALWPYAITMAVMQHNSVPHTGQKVTPHELMYDEQPDLRLMRAFGALGYVHKNADERNGKLDERAVPAACLGVAPSSKAWLMLDPRGRVRTSYHVRFHKGTVADAPAGPAMSRWLAHAQREEEEEAPPSEGAPLEKGGDCDFAGERGEEEHSPRHSLPGSVALDAGGQLEELDTIEDGEEEAAAFLNGGGGQGAAPPGRVRAPTNEEGASSGPLGAAEEAYVPPGGSTHAPPASLVSEDVQGGGRLRRRSARSNIGQAPVQHWQQSLQMKALEQRARPSMQRTVPEGTPAAGEGGPPSLRTKARAATPQHTEVASSATAGGGGTARRGPDKMGGKVRHARAAVASSTAAPPVVSEGAIEAAASSSGEAIVRDSISRTHEEELLRELASGGRHMARRASSGPAAKNKSAPFAHRSGSLNDVKKLADPSGHWKAARVEMANMEKMQVFEPVIVERAEAAKLLIRSMMIFRDKTDPDGHLTKIKARLVALGNFQTTEQYDADSISAHVPRSDSVRAVAATAAALNKVLYTMDISHAFLHAQLSTLLYIDLQPELFSLLSEEMHDRIAALEKTVSKPGQAVFLRLNKSIYGLKQAAANWMRCAADSLRRFGLRPCEKDQCVWHAPAELGMGLLIVVIYVDDFLILASSVEARGKFERHVRADFTAGPAEEAHAYIGFRLERDAVSGSYHLSMPGMVRSVLERFDMADCTTRPTPAVKLAKEDEARLLPEEGSPEDIAAQREPYRAMVGCLSYLAYSVRPDIVMAVRRLASATQRWGLMHIRWAKRVMRYLKGTAELGLLYESDGAPLLSASSDASHGDNKETGRSTSGWLVNVANGPIAWGSKWQNEVATSTTSAEFMAVYDVALQVAGFRMLLAELGFEQRQPTPLLCDNQSAIFWAQRRGRLEAKKHVRIRYFKVCELADAGEIKVTYTPTTAMPSDMLTKVLEEAAFVPIRDLVVKPPPSAARNDCDDGDRGVTEIQAQP